MYALRQEAPMGHNNPPSDLKIVKSRLDERERLIRESLNNINATPLPEVINDKAVSGQVTERIKSLRNIKGAVEDAHGEIKKPYLECGQAVDVWKRNFLAEVDAFRAAAEKPQMDFLAREEAAETQRQLEIARLQREESERLAAEALAHQAANIQDAARELLDEAVKSEALANRIEDNITYARPSDMAKSRSLQGSVSSRKMAWVGRIKSLRGIDLEVLRPYLNEEAIQKALNAFVKNGGRECAGAEIKEEVTGLNIR